MTEWPAWKPQSVLKAEQLIALESYLLTPWSFTADFCAGVDSMLPDSVTAQNSADELVVSARDVHGLTAGGCPVIVGNDESLQAKMKLSPGGSVTFDAVVVVNDEAAAQKCALLLLTPETSPKGGEWLALGRYSWDAQNGLRRSARPPVRRLAALSHDPDWFQWVAPFVDAIETLSTQVGPPPQMENIRLVAFATEICQLHFDWPTRTVVSLIRAARFLDWLRNAGNGTMPNIARPATPEDAARLQEHGSDDLPKQLRLSLVQAAPPTSSNDKLTLSSDYQVQLIDTGITVSLLRALPAGRLELRIPAAMLDGSESLTVLTSGVGPLVVAGSAMGADRRFTLPERKTQYPRDYAFDVLSPRLAAPNRVVIELWHSKQLGVE